MKRVHILLVLGFAGLVTSLLMVRSKVTDLDKIRDPGADRRLEYKPTINNVRGDTALTQITPNLSPNHLNRISVVEKVLSNIKSEFKNNERKRSKVVHEAIDTTGRQIVIQLRSPESEDIGEMSEAISKELKSIERDSATYKHVRQQAVETLKHYTSYGAKFRYLFVASPISDTKPVTLITVESGLSEIKIDSSSNLALLPKDGPIDILVGDNMADLNSTNRTRYGYLFDIPVAPEKSK